MAHTRCMLVKQGYTHAQTNVWYLLLFYGNNDSRTRLNVTLYVRFLSCSLYTLVYFQQLHKV
jgi:hypothetical protein